MSKVVFMYEDMAKNAVPELITMTEISSITGMSYSTLQRLLKDSDRYYDSQGRFRIVKINKRQDGRKSNCNPNLNNR